MKHEGFQATLRSRSDLQMRSGGNSNDWGRSMVQSPALCRSLVTLPSRKAVLRIVA